MEAKHDAVHIRGWVGVGGPGYEIGTEPWGAGRSEGWRRIEWGAVWGRQGGTCGVRDTGEWGFVYGRQSGVNCSRADRQGRVSCGREGLQGGVTCHRVG